MSDNNWLSRREQLSAFIDRHGLALTMWTLSKIIADRSNNAVQRDERAKFGPDGAVYELGAWEAEFAVKSLIELHNFVTQASKVSS